MSLNTELENDSIPYESSHRRGDGAAGRGEIFNMDWLDSLEFKEENQENEENGYPEKDSERKRKHNQGEGGREGECAPTSPQPFFLVGCSRDVKMDHWR